MFQKRTSPTSSSGFAGTGLKIGEIKLFDGYNFPIEQPQRQGKPRGACNHQRKQPSFYVPPMNHKNRPVVIKEAINALKQTYKHAKLLPDLFYRKQKVHSQRREAIIRVLQVMLHYMDLETLEVGFFNSAGEFIRLDTAKIAQYADLSLIRTNRAISDITRAGYLTSIRQYKTTIDGHKIGITSIRTISRKLFTALKIDHFSLFYAIERKRKRNEKILAKKNGEKLNILIKSFSHTIKTNTSNISSSPMRRAAMLLERTTQEIMPIINDIRRKRD